MPANSKTKHVARHMELSSDGKIQIKWLKLMHIAKALYDIMKEI